MGRKLFIVFNWLFITCTINYLQAQPNCKIVHYSTEDGLSHDNLTSILKDREGFMWFGTWDGINRYDGHNFITYKSHRGDYSELKNNRIDQIVEDKRGFLWLRAYDNQIYRFDKRREQFYAISRSLRKGAGKYNFLSVKPSANGDVWLITESNGVFYTANPDADNPVFQQYSATEQPAFRLPSNHINFFWQDKQQHIWLGTSDGLCQLSKDGKGYQVKHFSLPKELSTTPFLSVAENNDDVWFGTANGYCVKYNKLSHRFTCVKLSDKAINGLRVSHLNNLIYASTDGGELITVPYSGVAPKTLHIGEIPLFSIYEDASGILWIEPENHGVVRLNPLTSVYKTYSQPNAANYLNGRASFKVFEDNKGLVWVNLKGGGFGYYDRQKDSVAYFYDGPDLLSHRFSNMVNALLYDPAGVMWLSSDERGLTKVVFQPNNFNRALLKSSSKKSENEVRAIYSDREQRLWVATKAGKLYVKDAAGNLLSDIFVNGELNTLGQVYCILEDSSGVIWLGTKADGLYRAIPVNGQRDRYRLEHYRKKKNDLNSISSDEIYSITEDGAHRLWIATFDNGLNMLKTDNTGLHFFNIENSFKSYPANFKKIRHLCFDTHGRLWVASTNGLIIIKAFNERSGQLSFVTYTKMPGRPQSLANNDIQYIYKDVRDQMWLGTAGGGMDVTTDDIDHGPLQFRNYSTANGMPNDYILSCVEDQQNRLWIATQKGLSCFDPVHKHFTNYDSDDGLPGGSFSEATCAKMGNGSLVFGTIRGYINFNPNEIRSKPLAGNMVLTNLQINNKDVSDSAGSGFAGMVANYIAKLRLNHDQNVLKFDYTVLDYRSSYKQHYQYRLKNFDQGWKDNKDQRTATYTNIPPGNYEFEVRCLNSDLYSNIPYKSLAIVIDPPFWKTWWAYLGYAIIALVLFEFTRRTALMMLKLRQRIAVEQKLAELKTVFFTNVSHELRTPLTLILNPIEEIAVKETLSEEGRQYINVIRRNANRMVRFINQLLDLRKLQSGKARLKISYIEMVSFTERIISYFCEKAREKNISLTLKHADGEFFVWVDAEKIDIVIFNLIANAIKFSPAGKTISIHIFEDAAREWLGIEVRDEGAGVPNERLKDIFELYYEGDHPDTLKGTGIGLALSKELIELHHGTIAAKNHQGSGFSVQMNLKLGKGHFNHEEAQIIDMPEIDRFESYDEPLNLPLTPGVHVPGEQLPVLLLVEDNQELRSFLQQQLSSFYHVETAEDGEQGLAKVAALSPNLILSDVMMPKMDGITMLDKLKNDPKTSHIPVILLTARFSVEHQIEGLKYGADLYITKPFQTTFLMAAIANLLKQRRTLFESLVEKPVKIKLEPGELVITSKDEIFLKQIIDIVEKGMEDPEFSIDQVAESIGMGRTTFYTKFKSLTGLAPVEFVREMRLKRGKQYLDAGESNIATVAYSVGFNSAKYFGTCFKEKYSVTPSEYLKTLKVK